MRWIYLTSVWLHVLAAMTWVGGMVTFVVVVMPFFRQHDETVRSAFFHDFGSRFRKVAWGCFAILAITGTFNLWMRGVRPADFLRPEWRSSSFGLLILIKLSLVLAAVVISGLHERATSRWRARWLGRLTLVVGLVIVAVGVMLVRSL